MADARATASVWNLRADDVAVKRYKSQAALYLELGELVSVTLGLDREAAADEAAAMRKLERLAGELAAELERRAAAREDGADA